jgi:hypothetical protein
MTERTFRRIVTGHDKDGCAVIMENRAPVRVFDKNGIVLDCEITLIVRREY